MSKQFAAVIIVIILGLVGIFYFTGHKSTSNSSSTTLSSHIQGKATTGVTLVEYGDFECPYCAQYFPTIKSVEQFYGDKIGVQFRNYPLTSIHQNAFAAARAAEAASLQGKFFEMHDQLYINQNAWAGAGDPLPAFEAYAKQIGLKADQFVTDYGSAKVNDQINADRAEGARLGITGTPTYFLDGKKVQIANSVDEFKKVIDAEIAKKAPGTSTGAATTTPPPTASAPTGAPTTGSTITPAPTAGQ
jgi:protein-disulfide isomerase